VRGVAVAGSFRPCRCLNPLLGRGLSASWRTGAAFRRNKDVGSHIVLISGLHHTACSLAVYASQLSFTPRGSYGHARLASGWWSTFAGRDWLPARSLVKFPLRLHPLPPHPGFAWRNASRALLPLGHPVSPFPEPCQPGERIRAMGFRSRSCAHLVVRSASGGMFLREAREPCDNLRALVRCW